MKPKTIKLVDDNIEENLVDFGYSNNLLDRVPKAWPMKEMVDKLDFIKMKIFCFVKDYVKRIKKQGHGMEENICQ